MSLEAQNAKLPAASAPASQAVTGDWVRIKVMDTGGGIASDVLPKIFDPYFSTKRRGTQKGMGLGLTVCRAAIQEHGGTIAVESSTQNGTTVTCHLPAARRTSGGTAVTLPNPQ